MLRTYYYNCMPYKSKFPTAAESNRYAKAQKFMDYLENLDRYSVRLGKLAYRGTNADGTPILQQKRVDILLACDLVLLSANNALAERFLLQEMMLSN